MITATILISIDGEKEGCIRCRSVNKDVNEITEETLQELLRFANTQLNEYEYIYEICAQQPHSKSSLPQPFYDYFNGSLVEYWNS